MGLHDLSKILLSVVRQHFIHLLPCRQSSKFGLESVSPSHESGELDPNPRPATGANPNPSKPASVLLLLLPMDCLGLSCGPLWPMSWERSSGGLLGKVSSLWKETFTNTWSSSSQCGCVCVWCTKRQQPSSAMGRVSLRMRIIHPGWQNRIRILDDLFLKQWI